MAGKIKIVTFGKIKSKEIEDLSIYYQKLISKYAWIEHIQLKDVGERKIELSDYDKKGFLVVLSEHGKIFNTDDFKTEIIMNLNLGVEINFLIGNAYGVTRQLMEHADLVLSLSPMTFSHELALLILSEQLFRILNLDAGGRYHK